MKRIISLLLAGVLLFCCSACGKKDKTEATTEPEVKEVVINSVADIYNLNEILDVVENYYLTIDAFKLDLNTRLAENEDFFPVALVTNYSSINDIKNYLKKYCTDDMVNTICNTYTVPYASDYYVEKDNKLYWGTQVDYSEIDAKPATAEIVNTFPDKLCVIKVTFSVEGEDSNYLLALKVIDNEIKLDRVELGIEDVALLSCISDAYKTLVLFRDYFEYHNINEFVNIKDYVSVDETFTCYYRLEGFATKDDFKNYLLQYFSKKAIDVLGWFNDEEAFLEKNGKLYCNMNFTKYDNDQDYMWNGSAVYVAYDSLKIKSISEDKTRIEVTSYIANSGEF